MKLTYRRFLILMLVVSCVALVLPFVVGAVHFYLGLTERLPNPEAGFMPLLEASAESLHLMESSLYVFGFGLFALPLSLIFLFASIFFGKHKA